MHEMSLTRDIVKTVVHEAEMAGAQRVVGVHLTLGEVHDIVDDLFERCFRFVARGTIAQFARVEISRIPLTVRCDDCSTVFRVDLYCPQEERVRCPVCGSKRYSINSGNEFLIDDIEISDGPEDNAEHCVA
ncbi:MAG: hydrogenase maturation nickel metallochaperone HypA [Coriobacteriales bacterium]|jgi:hydrogenase nickel incorporation protein HypA/HybF